MKGSLTKLVSAVACTMAFGACLIGCGDSIENVSPLRFDSKYYTETSGPEEERGYYTFSSNGTGKYYNYSYYSSYYSSDEISNYTISFKFTYANAEKTKIACFYDGVTYTDKDNQKDVSTSWTRVLEVSDNVLLTQGMAGDYVEAINEEYLKQLPNFDK